jgi:hypothetical protein
MFLSSRPSLGPRSSGFVQEPLLLMAATVKSKRFRAAVSRANRSGVSQVHHGCLIAATSLGVAVC